MIFYDAFNTTVADAGIIYDGAQVIAFCKCGIFSIETIDEEIETADVTGNGFEQFIDLPVGEAAVGINCVDYADRAIKRLCFFNEIGKCISGVY